MKNYWLVKSEPNAYSWSDLVKEKRRPVGPVWRNFTARNNSAACAVVMSSLLSQRHDKAVSV